MVVEVPDDPVLLLPRQPVQFAAQLPAAHAEISAREPLRDHFGTADECCCHRAPRQRRKHPAAVEGVKNDEGEPSGKRAEEETHPGPVRIPPPLPDAADLVGSGGDLLAERADALTRSIRQWCTRRAAQGTAPSATARRSL